MSMVTFVVTALLINTLLIMLYSQYDFETMMHPSKHRTLVRIVIACISGFTTMVMMEGYVPL